MLEAPTQIHRPAHASQRSPFRLAVLVYEWSTHLMGGSIRAMTFVRWLANSGWRVTVFTATPPEEWPETMEGVTVHHVPSPERQLGGGISAEGGSQLKRNPTWLKALGSIKSLLPLERQLSWYPGLWRAVPGICARESVQALLTVVAPNVLMPIGHHLARRVGIPHVIDLRDDFADRKHVESITGSYQALLNRYGHRYLRQAAAVSVVSPVTRKRLAGIGIESRVVMNGYVEGHFAHLPWEASPVPSDGPLRIMHLGWLGDFRSIAPLVRAIDGFQDPGAVRIDHYGLIDPGQEAILTAAACPTQVHPQVPHGEAVALMAQSDVLLAIPGDRVPAALTGKLFEYLRTRRPVMLLAAPGAARELGHAAGILAVCDPRDVKGIRSKLEHLLESKRDGVLRATADPEFVRKLDREAGARKMEALLARVIAA
ncbi:MAG: glycosyltransferase [Rhodothermales bacterium]|nr:glycosyltransferase [Rhodothermales bacterium]